MNSNTTDLFFIANRQFNEESTCLIRIKGTSGSPHIAFTNRDIANAYIKRIKADSVSKLIAENEIRPEMRFDFSFGLLIITSLEQAIELLENPDKFNFQSNIIQYKGPFKSLNPW